MMALKSPRRRVRMVSGPPPARPPRRRTRLRLIAPRRGLWGDVGQRRVVVRMAGAATLLHLAVLAIFAFRPAPPPMEQVQTFAIDLAFPPPEAMGIARPAEGGPAPEPDALKDEPVPDVPPPEEAPAPKVEEKREPVKPKAEAPRPPANRAAEGEGKGRSTGGDQAVATGDNPSDATLQGEGLNVQISGADFPYPAYLENIIVQINRHFRRPAGARAAEAVVGFSIGRDGAVSDLRVVRSSGGYAFRSAAMEAVEQAGRRGLFGPLPEGFPESRLPIVFEFKPAR